MIIRTGLTFITVHLPIMKLMILIDGLRALTLFGPIVVGVVFKLLPAVTKSAVKCIWTLLLILLDEVVRLPVRTGVGFIVVLMRLPSVILPVVSVYTLSSVMIDKVKWTKYGFVVKNVEIVIVFKIMDQFDHYILFVVGEGTENSVFAVAAVIWIFCAKFLLIFVDAIKRLDFVVAFWAIMS